MHEYIFPSFSTESTPPRSIHLFSSFVVNIDNGKLLAIISDSAHRSTRSSTSATLSARQSHCPQQPYFPIYHNPRLSVSSLYRLEIRKEPQTLL